MTFKELAAEIDNELDSSKQLKDQLAQAELVLNRAQAAYIASVNKVKDLYAQMHAQMGEFAPSVSKPATSHGL